MMNRSPFWKRGGGLGDLILVLGSGLLMGLTPAPGNLWGLAWVALLPLWVLVNGDRKTHRLLTKLLLGLAWGLGYYGLSLVWILGLHPLTWMGLSWVASVSIALFCWVAITLWGSVFVILWAAGMQGLNRWLDRQNGGRFSTVKIILLRVLGGTALWCGLETLRNQSALDWASLSFTQSPHNLLILHLGQLSGPMAVTATIVGVNALGAEAWLARSRSPVRVRALLGLGLGLLVSGHLLGWGLYQRPLEQPADRALQLGIIQGNIPTRIKLFDEGVQLALQNYVQGYETLADQGVDGVLTPEGAFPWLWIESPRRREHPFYQAILDRGVLAWVGTVGLKQGRITQSLFTVTGRGDIVGRFNKVKLVPLGESVPFEAVLGQFINRLSPVEASMVAGSFDQRVETPWGRAIVGICYDSAFPELFRWQAAQGGQWILTASNNDPYNAAMMTQHHAQDVMRSIETDRWAVRATNTGFSGVVDPHGRTLWLSGFRTYETHAHTIYRRQNLTPYGRWGDWLTPTLLIMAGLGCGLEGWQRLQSGDARPPE